MPVTNDELMEKLNNVEKLLKKLLKEEGKELDALNADKEFNNPEDWQQYVWKNCEFKTEKTDSSEIDFWCKKQDALCRFESCPLNIKG